MMGVDLHASVTNEDAAWKFKVDSLQIALAYRCILFVPRQLGHRNILGFFSFVVNL